MSVIALVDAFCYVHGHDFTTDTNTLSLAAEAQVKDKTTFGSQGWNELAAGLKAGQFSMGGFWQAGADQVDPQLAADLGVRDRVFTFGPIETEGQPAYLWQGGHFTYQAFGEIGELIPFTAEAASTDGVGVVRGQLAAAKQVKAATGALGSALNLGAVGAAQFAYATLHLFGTPGTTITVQLQSDDAVGFPSPTTRATLGPLTAAGGTWMTRVPGAITDTYWRFNISAITGSWTVAGAIGIQ